MPRRPFKLAARPARFAGAAKGETFAESGFKRELRGSDERTVATRASDTALEPRMQRLLERLSANPADMAAFATLEEHLFLAGDWGRLAGIYECRISALQPGDRELPELLLRLARLGAYLRVLRPLVWTVRALGFLLRGLDRVVRRHARALEREVILFPTPGERREPWRRDVYRSGWRLHGFLLSVHYTIRGFYQAIISRGRS